MKSQKTKQPRVTKRLEEVSRHPEILGWGADLDPKKRPAVPRERTPARFIHPHWTKLHPQHPRVKIYYSVERPAVTPIFGTSTPPSGLSGLIRTYAYNLSENDIRHWLLL